jgi:hypothetical protein
LGNDLNISTVYYTGINEGKKFEYFHSSDFKYLTVGEGVNSYYVNPAGMDDLVFNKIRNVERFANGELVIENGKLFLSYNYEKEPPFHVKGVRFDRLENPSVREEYKVIDPVYEDAKQLFKRYTKIPEVSGCSYKKKEVAFVFSPKSNQFQP